MRLLLRENDGFRLKEFTEDDAIPRYAILSHTWGAESEEVTHTDLISGAGKDKPGYGKLEFCANQADQDGLQYFWIDTCCIERGNSSELQYALKSIFRWYAKATCCYVFLPDVSEEQNPDPLLAQLRKSRWFIRGWTLPELLAPKSVEFFSKERKRLGNKDSLEDVINGITGIPVAALRGEPLSNFDHKERFSWAENRQTKLEEDRVYSLLAIFDVDIDIRYGEGMKRASERLKTAIGETTQSIQETYPTPSKDPYSEAPINLSQPEFRLLQLEPNNSSTIQCRLTTHSFEQAYPEYVALSYSWGKPGIFDYIILNGIRFGVGENLWWFLKCMCTRKQYIVFWIDALCINQTDIAERNDQVKIMPHIYINASSVSVWLGKQDATTDAAMQYLKSKQVWDVSSGTINQAESLLALCNIEYWRRIWIVQELILAKKATLYCGSEDVDWEAFEQFFTDLDTQPRSKLHDRGVDSATRLLNSPAAVLVEAKKSWVEEHMPLTTLLRLYHDRDSTLVLDKVYALHGLAKDSSDIPMDYAMSPMDLLAEVLGHACAENAGAGEGLVKFGRMVANMLQLSCTDEIIKKHVDSAVLQLSPWSSLISELADSAGGSRLDMCFLRNVIRALHTRDATMADSPGNLKGNFEDIRDWIMNERLRVMPNEGDAFDTTLQLIDSFSEHLRDFDRVIQKLAPGSAIPGAFGYGHAIILSEANSMLLRTKRGQLKANQSKAIYNAFLLLNRYCQKFALLTNRMVRCETTEDMRNGLSLLYGSLLTLVTDMSTYVYKLSQGLANDPTSNHVDIRYTAVTFDSNYATLVDKIWTSQLQGTDCVVPFNELKQLLAPEEKIEMYINQDSMALSAQRVEFTCQWFKRTLAPFLQRTATILVATGAEGTGKSMVAAWAAEWIAQTSIRKARWSVIYYRSTHTTAVEILKSVLSQLLDVQLGETSTYCAVADAYNSTVHSSVEERLWEALYAGLAKANTESARIVLIIDGVDHVRNEEGSVDFLNKFLAMHTYLGRQIKLMAFSREVNLPSEEGGKIIRMPHDEDIQAISEHLLEQSYIFRNVKDKQGTLSRVFVASKGSFLRNMLLCQLLLRQKTLARFMEALHSAETIYESVDDLVLAVLQSLQLDENSRIALAFFVDKKKRDLAQLSAALTSQGKIDVDISRVLRSLGPLISLHEDIAWIRHDDIAGSIKRLCAEGRLTLPVFGLYEQDSCESFRP